MNGRWNPRNGSTVLTGGAGRPSGSARARRNADLFLADLMGRGAGRGAAPPFEDQGEGTEPDGGPAGREPFFGDERGESWRVVAGPGAGPGAGDRGLPRLRDGDLIVRRMPAERGGRGWQCLRKEDVDVETLRGPDGRLRDDTVVLRRVRRSRRAPGPGATNGAPRGATRSATHSATSEVLDELLEVCAFFGPNDLRRTEQQVRDAVVARAEAEWAAWHTSAGALRLENDGGMFGRLLGYYLAAGNMAPDTLTAVQSAALGLDYAPFLAASPGSAAQASIRNQLLTSAPGATVNALNTALDQARQAHTGTGALSPWSAAFVVACVRGAAIDQGLEAVIGTGASRRRWGRDQLLKATLAHAIYTIEARERRAGTRPPRPQPPPHGTYHAFRPDERAPQRGDIIVQDRRDAISASQVVTLAALSGGITHGDIVVDVQPGFVVAIGGNVGNSARKRRFPRDADGMLIVDPQRLFTQENNAGTLPALPPPPAQPPPPSTQNLAARSTARIFALLAPVAFCAAVPGQPYGGGFLV